MSKPIDTIVKDFVGENQVQRSPSLGAYVVAGDHGDNFPLVLGFKQDGATATLLEELGK